ncbi:hypothetical protein VKT23_013405 [Stygiomarasmius scandens]|uniref:Uncharacterized protein n=1 Tax=Marasmiellus scandens TaxID=2682957 RepID=A0ABR1J3C1_9AGAR
MCLHEHEALPSLTPSQPQKAEKQIQWELLQEYVTSEEMIDPESLLLALPSNISPADRVRVGWRGFADTEAKLRQGVLQNTLTELRILLGEKLMRYRDLRNNDSQMRRGRSQMGINSLQKKLKAIQKVYVSQVNALSRLLDPKVVKEKWKEISDDDLNVTSHVPLKKGDLAWFWESTDVSIDTDLEYSPAMKKFYKVSYLRGLARWQRWREEVLLVRKEMGWRIEWFKKASNTWRSRANTESLSYGGKAYALAQAARWKGFMERSQRRFAKLQTDKWDGTDTYFSMCAISGVMAEGED